MMKEKKVFAIFSDRMRSREDKSEQLPGIAVFIFVGFAIYGAALLLLQGYVFKYPIFFLTNPGLFLLACCFVPGVRFSGRFHLIVTLLSLPAFATQMYTILDFFISNFGLDLKTPGLSRNYSFLLNAAYGSWSGQFDYYGILQDMMATKKISFVAFAFLTGFLCYLATLINTMFFASDIAAWIDIRTDNYFDEEDEKERWFISSCLGVLGAGLFYWITFPYFGFVQGLPFGLSYIATWLLLLTPILGLGLCEVNRCRRFKYRVGNSIIYFFMLLLTLMCVAYIVTHTREFYYSLTQCIQGNYEYISRIAYPLSLCLLPYMYVSRKKNLREKK